jgi:GxxExxY protein
VDNRLEENKVGDLIVASALRVHTALGPGLLESAYEACLAYELGKHGLDVRQQVPIPLQYEGVALDVGYRLDLLVAQLVIIELKAIEKVLPLHKAQLLCYLKLSKLRLGYMLNFNVAHMRDGIKRVVNAL